MALVLIGARIGSVVAQLVPIDPPSFPIVRTNLPRNWIATGVASDLAIAGPGYFVVRDPWSSGGEVRFTRYGSFHTDERGRLTDDFGFRVQALSPETGGTRDLEIGNRESPREGPTISSWQFDETGAWILRWDDGTLESLGRLAIWPDKAGPGWRRISEQAYVDSNLPPDWQDQLIAADGSAVAVQAGALELPPPELQVAAFDSRRTLDTRVFPVWVGLPFCLYLDGPDFLVVRDPTTNARYLSRCGALKTDWDGWLVTLAEGYRVQGLNSAELDQVGDLRVDGEGRPYHADPDSALTGAWVSPTGDIEVSLSDGTLFTRGRILLQSPPDRRSIRAIGTGLWLSDAAAEFELNDESDRPSGTRILTTFLDPRFLTPAIQTALRQSMVSYQQEISATTVPSHLALLGQGFFLLRDPDTGEFMLTRWGDFGWSNEGYLEGVHGWRVQARSLRGEREGPFDLQKPSASLTGLDEAFTIAFDGGLVCAPLTGAERAEVAVIVVQIPDPTVLNEIRPFHFRVPAQVGDLGTWLRDVAAPELAYWRIASGALERVWDPVIPLDTEIPVACTQLRVFGTMHHRLTIQTSFDLRNWWNWMCFDDQRRLRPVWSGFEAPSALSAIVMDETIFDPGPEDSRPRFYRVVDDGLLR